MSADYEDSVLAAALRASSAEARRRLDTHPTSDQLLAYHDRELDADEAERLREHLALCGECTQRALDLEGFSRQARGESSHEREANAAWARTRRVLMQEGLISESNTATPSRLGLWWGARPRLAYATAAVFLLTSIGLSVRLAEVDRSLQKLASPRADAQILSPRPLGDGGERASPLQTKTATTDKDLVLILNVLDPQVHQRYEVEFSSGLGQLFRTEVSLSQEADFTVLIPAGVLRAGRYEIRLYGVAGAQEELLADYELVVTGTNSL